MKKVNLKMSKKKVLLMLPIFLVIGFFVYKYTYIYVVRRDLNQAGKEVKVVQEKLAQQGIVATYDESCGKDEGKYDSGVRHCGPSISYTKEMSKEEAVQTADKIINTLKKDGFEIKYDDNEIDEESNNFTFEILHQTTQNIKNARRCALVFENLNADENLPEFKFDFQLYCGKNVRFWVY